MIQAQNDSPTPTNSPTETVKRPSRSAAEWVTFGIASLILAAIAGLVVYGWATKRDLPPVLTIHQTETVRETNGQFYVPFEISNAGGETAKSVQIIAELRVNGTVKESGDLEIDFLSENERQAGAFVFDQDPRQGELRLRVSSYKAP
ncbi:MAG: TIGR02588 family protein [Leptolyngbyaceae cyanobacterium RU_5_1]|nr:TIGR02588 family protein [Leptolyngbyaceae cyanobacterium RU_5_1]